jgi:hypothetical protein
MHRWTLFVGRLKSIGPSRAGIATFGEKTQLRLVLFGGELFRFRWQRKFVAEALSETLSRFRPEAFEMIADESPDVARFGKMTLDFQGPTFQRGLAFPKKLVVAMNEFPSAVVFGGVIA